MVWKKRLGIVAATGILLCVLLAVTPVKSNFADPCGSLLFPTDVTFQLDGEVVHQNTPPCRDARMDRLPVVAIVGVLGLAMGVAALAVRSEDRDAD